MLKQYKSMEKNIKYQIYSSAQVKKEKGGEQCLIASIILEYKKQTEKEKYWIPWLFFPPFEDYFNEDDFSRKQ